MADNEVEENVNRGVEWEVVSLTASTYAAAPGPNEPKLKDNDEGIIYREDEGETSHALFMSGHFDFPPSQHEKLALEPDKREILDDHIVKKVAPEVSIEEENKSVGKKVEDWTLKGLEVSDEFPDMIFDEKGNKLPISGAGLEESMNLENEASLYKSLHSETEFVGLTTYDETLHIPEASKQSDQGLDVPLDISCSPNPVRDDKDDGSNVPCESWWKRTAASLYGHAKEANAFWSIFIAAAVMGLVILGQRWQQERRQVMQLKLQGTINNQRSGKIVVPMNVLKDVIMGGHRPGSFVSGSSAAGN